MTLQTVGIHNLTRPISIKTKIGATQQTVATIDLDALLPHERSQSCIEVMMPLLAEYAEDIHVGVFPELLFIVREQLQAKEARLTMTFPYFINKKAPVSATSSLMEYQCTLTGTSTKTSSPLIRVLVPVTTLCPCSKEISTAGAHNQRAEVALTVQPNGFIWLEDLITLVEESGSCQLYSLLKRPDEKYVTEMAYENPMFVEDVARMVALKTRNLKSIEWFSVGVESFESIHKHSAYAYIDSSDLRDSSN